MYEAILQGDVGFLTFTNMALGVERKRKAWTIIPMKGYGDNEPLEVSYLSDYIILQSIFLRI